MDFYEEVRKVLSIDYSGGMTYQEIAKKYGLSYVYVRALIKGERPVSGITLSTFFKMFPHARIDLHPSSDSSSSQVMHHVGDGNRQIIGGGSVDSLEAYQLRLYRGLATLPVPDDAKAKVLALIQEAAAG
ncbi:MAG: hypothetical protein ACI4SG_00635 [Oligosphaeraceae bacterium]